MPCEKPIKAWRPALSGPLRFDPPNNGRAYTPINIPCGYCLLCREEQARQQAVRVTHEAMSHEENCFVTLTYDNKNLPPYGGLRYDDLVKFWKRVRKFLWKHYRKRLRYYAVGEYGDKTLRPHYHACIFGHAFTEGRVILKTTPHLLWWSPELAQLWGMGNNVSVGALNFETARYTASYVTKKLRMKQQYVRIEEETGELVKLEQPRAFMSRNLARKWWEENRHYVSATDTVIINGRKQKPPKAYDKWLGEVNKLPLEMVKEERKRKSKTTTKGETRARAATARARAGMKKKSI